jgi:hypothetical protein
MFSGQPFHGMPAFASSPVTLEEANHSDRLLTIACSSYVMPPLEQVEGSNRGFGGAGHSFPFFLETNIIENLIGNLLSLINLFLIFLLIYSFNS